MTTSSRLGRAIAGACRDVFVRSEWNIGIVRRPIHAFLDPEFRPEISWFPDPGSGRLLADPFGLVKDGSLYVLCEEMDYGPRRGQIACVTVSGNVASPPRTVLSRPWHLSYPFLLEHDGHVYCVPETFEAREIALYRADPFPDRWTRVGPLVSNVRGLDGTIVRYQDRWWLFYTDQDQGPHHRLFIRHSQDLLGPWEPHARQPVKSDLASARPGGTPFEHEGNLYRPAQDCSRSYGGRVVINRVTRLSPTEFDEQPVAFVGPFPDSQHPDGAHTLSAVGDLTLVDAKRDRFIPRAFRSAIVRTLRRSLGRRGPDGEAGRIVHPSSQDA